MSCCAIVACNPVMIDKSGAHNVRGPHKISEIRAVLNHAKVFEGQNSSNRTIAQTIPHTIHVTFG